MAGPIQGPPNPPGPHHPQLEAIQPKLVNPHKLTTRKPPSTEGLREALCKAPTYLEQRAAIVNYIHNWFTTCYPEKNLTHATLQQISTQPPNNQSFFSFMREIAKQFGGNPPSGEFSEHLGYLTALFRARQIFEFSKPQELQKFAQACVKKTRLKSLPFPTTQKSSPKYGPAATKKNLTYWIGIAENLNDQIANFLLLSKYYPPHNPQTAPKTPEEKATAKAIKWLEEQKQRATSPLPPQNSLSRASSSSSSFYRPTPANSASSGVGLRTKRANDEGKIYSSGDYSGPTKTTPSKRRRTTPASSPDSSPSQTTSTSVGPSSSGANSNSIEIFSSKIIINGKSIIIPKITIPQSQLKDSQHNIQKLMAARLAYAESHPDADPQRQKRKINILKNKQGIYKAQQQHGLLPDKLTVHKLENVPAADIKTFPVLPTGKQFKDYIDWQNSGTDYIEWHENNPAPNFTLFKVNFANANYGGGTFTYGDVQEEKKNQLSSSAAALTAISQREPLSSHLKINLEDEQGKPTPAIIVGQVADIHLGDKLMKQKNLGAYKQNENAKIRRLNSPQPFNELAMTAQELPSRGQDTEESATHIFQATYKAILAALALSETGKCLIETGLIGCGAFNNHPYVSIGAQLLAAQAAEAQLLADQAAGGQLLADQATNVLFRFKGVDPKIAKAVSDHLDAEKAKNPAPSYEQLLTSLVIWAKANPQ